MDEPFLDDEPAIASQELQYEDHEPESAADPEAFPEDVAGIEEQAPVVPPEAIAEPVSEAPDAEPDSPEAPPAKSIDQLLDS